MNDLLSRLRALFEGLAPRERLLVALAGGLFALLLAWFGVVRPIASSVAGREARVEAAKDDLEAARRLRRDLDEVRGRLAQVEGRIGRNRGANLFTTLETLARQSAVKVESMEPQTAPAGDRYRETKVQVVLKGVTLAQTVSYLHQIEASQELLSIKSLRIHTRPDKPELLNVTFTVSSFEPV